MNALAQRIAGLIAAQGPLSIAQYMTMALHDPQYGYYVTGDPFGEAGDFVTAPEMGQMFGELLGLWAAQCWIDQGRPANPRLVELGPGRGTLMEDALRALYLVPEFRESLEVVMVETNPALRTCQQEVLRGCGVTVRWCERFDASLTDRPLFLLANEFFDALPIRQFVRTERGWCERMVGLNESGALNLALAPAPAAGVAPERGGAPLGGFYETSPASAALTDEISQVIAARGGAALIIDYGYGGEAGWGETLQTIRRHEFAGLLDTPGEADISAHVDFAALAQAAREGGCAAYGPVDQGEFLIGLGIVERGRKLRQLDVVERLTAPEQMGTLFKALAILPASAPKPPGF